MSISLSFKIKESGEKSAYSTTSFLCNLADGKRVNHTASYSCREDTIREYQDILMRIKLLLPNVLGEEFDHYTELGDVVESVEFGVNTVELSKQQMENLDEFIYSELHYEHDMYTVSSNSIIMQKTFLFGPTVSLLILLMRNMSKLFDESVTKEDLINHLVNATGFIGDEHILTALYVHSNFTLDALTVYYNDHSFYGPADYVAKRMFYEATGDEVTEFVTTHRKLIKPYSAGRSFWKLLLKEEDNNA